MNKRLIGALTAASLLLAGCSAADSAGNAQTETQTTDYIAQLTQNAGDDAKALEAWKGILQQTADAYDSNYHVEGDSFAYEYTTDKDSSNVNHSLMYRTGRDSVAMSDGDSEYITDLTDIDSSTDQFIRGFGTIARYGSDALVAAVSLDATGENELKGSILSVTSSDETIEEAEITNLMDTLVNFGYIRTVDPIHNASLYTFEQKEENGKTILSISVKDKEAFQKQAALKTILIDDRNDRPVLGLDEAEGETFTFTFNKNGVIESVENEVSHVLSALDNTAYVSLRNTTQVSAVTDKNLSVSAMDTFLTNNAKAENGTSFLIEDWK